MLDISSVTHHKTTTSSPLFFTQKWWVFILFISLILRRLSVYTCQVFLVSSKKPDRCFPRCKHTIATGQITSNAFILTSAGAHLQWVSNFYERFQRGCRVSKNWVNTLFPELHHRNVIARIKWNAWRCAPECRNKKEGIKPSLNQKKGCFRLHISQYPSVSNCGQSPQSLQGKRLYKTSSIGGCQLPFLCLFLHITLWK